MATPVKSIPEIPTTDTIVAGDEFLVKRPDTTKPDKIKWGTLETLALSGVPVSP